MEDLTGLKWIHSDERRKTDILLASAIAAPVALGTAVLATMVFIETGTNPILVQDRMGTDGKMFKQPKIRSFRTSHDFNDTFDPVAHANRLSRVGGFARSNHLDDFISVYNILKGIFLFGGPDRFLLAI